MGNIIGDFLSGDADDIKKNVKTKHEMEDKVEQTKNEFKVDSGYMTQEEADQSYEDFLKDNKERREDEISEADKNYAWSVALNTLGIAGSVAGGVGAVKGVKAAESAKFLKQAKAVGLVDKGVDALKVADKGADVAKVLDKGADAAEALDKAADAAKAVKETSKIGKITKGAAKVLTTPFKAYSKGVEGLTKFAGAGKVGRIVGVTGTILPMATTQIITRTHNMQLNNKELAEISRLDNLFNTTKDYDANMLDSQDQMLKDIGDGWNTATQSLHDDFDNGKITEAEYREKFGQIKDEYSQKYTEASEYFAGLGADLDSYLAYEQANYDTKLQIDPSNYDGGYINSTIYSAAPDAKAVAEEAYGKKNGLCSSEFTAFFATINAKIVSVCPFVASLEAAALKAADSAYDFVRDTVNENILHKEAGVSKYQDKSISDIAESIKNFSTEHLAVKEEYNGLLEATNVNTQVASSYAEMQALKNKEDENVEQTEQVVDQKASEPEPGADGYGFA